LNKTDSNGGFQKAIIDRGVPKRVDDKVWMNAVRPLDTGTDLDVVLTCGKNYTLTWIGHDTSNKY
jgi:hypothetical protein